MLQRENEVFLASMRIKPYHIFSQKDCKIHCPLELYIPVLCILTNTMKIFPACIETQRTKVLMCINYTIPAFLDVL